MSDDPFARLRALLAEFDDLRAVGCSDGNCKMLRRYRGMHTNGGCGCVARMSDLALEIAAEADRVKRFHGVAPLRGFFVS